MDASNPRGRVLIVDSDPVHGAEIEDALHSVNCKVFVCSALETALQTVRVEQIDLVVVVPNSPAHWRKRAESFSEAVRQLEEPPQIVFVLRCPYMGPADRLYGDRLNIKVLHER